MGGQDEFFIYILFYKKPKIWFKLNKGIFFYLCTWEFVFFFFFFFGDGKFSGFSEDKYWESISSAKSL
jgi:hypothetical protein